MTALDGVISASADYRKDSAVVVYEPDKITPERIAEEINTQTYYRARVGSEFTKTVRLKVPGLDTRAEVAQVDSTLRAVQGVKRITLLAESLSVDYDMRQTSPEQLVASIRDRTQFAASIDSANTGDDVESAAAMVVRVEGMTDEETASRVFMALMLDGILDNYVNAADATLTIVFDESRLTPDNIVSALRGAVSGTVELVSVSGSATGGNVFTGVWSVLGLVGAAVGTFLMWPKIKRRLHPASDVHIPPGPEHGPDGSDRGNRML